MVDGDEELLTTTQAAKKLGVAPRTLFRYAETGQLRPTLVLPSGHLRWSLEDIRRQLAEIRKQRNMNGDENE